VGIKLVTDGVTRIASGGVNAYLMDGPEGLTLVDTGPPGRGSRIEDALRKAKRPPGEVANILVTHYHPDHIGGLAELARKTGAPVYAHPLDAGIVRSGAPSPEGTPRSLLGRALMPMIRSKGTDPAAVSRELVGEEELPIAGGMRVIHTPGHTPGHTSFLWPSRGVLFVGDAAGNLLGRLGPALVDEDPAGADRSFVHLTTLDFDVALFGHGSPLVRNAAARFRRAAQARAG
jgi:glyoxylase-like metal-dependent hydrolase (beta-lactamase superfamily II)